MKTIISIGISVLLSATVVAGGEFVDDFNSAECKGRLAERGTWQFHDGIASCVAGLSAAA